MIWTIASNYCDYPSCRELSWQMKYIKRSQYDINHQPSPILNLYTPVLWAGKRQQCKEIETHVKHCWQQMIWPKHCGLLKLEINILTWTSVPVKLGVCAQHNLGSENQRITKGGKASKIIEPSHYPNTVSTTKPRPCPQVPHPQSFWAFPGMLIPQLPWGVCSNARPPFKWRVFS